MKSRYGYMYGSAAPKLPEQPRTEEQRVKRVLPVKRTAAGPEQRTFPLAQTVVCIVAGFAILFTLIFRYGVITEMNCDLTMLSEKYESLKDSNRKLQAEIGARINLENVRRIAEEKLNMQMPDSYQKIPVKVPKVNYSMMTEPVKKEDRSLKTFLASLLK